MECRDFECRWLLGDFVDDDRPDRLGVVICDDYEPTTGEAMVCVAEPASGASGSARVQALIAELLSRGETVLVRSPKRVRKLHPDGRVHEAEVDPQDPMLVNIRSSEGL